MARRERRAQQGAEDAERSGGADLPARLRALSRQARPDAPEGTSPDAPDGKPRKSDTDQAAPSQPPPEPPKEPGKWKDNRTNQQRGEHFEKEYVKYAKDKGRKVVGTQVPMEVRVGDKWVEIRPDAVEIVDGKVHLVDVKTSSTAKPIKNASGEVTGYEVDPRFTPNQKEAYPWAQAGSEVRIKEGTKAGDEALERLRRERIVPEGSSSLTIDDVRVELYTPANVAEPTSVLVGTRTNRAGRVVPDGSVRIP